MNAPKVSFTEAVEELNRAFAVFYAELAEELVPVMAAFEEAMESFDLAKPDPIYFIENSEAEDDE